MSYNARLYKPIRPGRFHWPAVLIQLETVNHCLIAFSRVSLCYYFIGWTQTLNISVEHFGELVLGLSPSDPSHLANSGALAQALTSDRLGRRGSILFWSAVFTIGVAIQTGTTYSLAQLVIGRYIAGLGVGALSGTDLCQVVIAN